MERQRKKEKKRWKKKKVTQITDTHTQSDALKEKETKIDKGGTENGKCKCERDREKQRLWGNVWQRQTYRSRDRERQLLRETDWVYMNVQESKHSDNKCLKPLPALSHRGSRSMRSVDKTWAMMYQEKENRMSRKMKFSGHILYGKFSTTHSI